MSSQFIEPKPEFRLVLVPAPDDPPLFSAEYQRELADFGEMLRAQDIEVSSRYCTFDAVGAGGGLSGEFILRVLTIVGPPLITGLAGWLGGRSGRKYRVKFGEIEAEGSTTKEAEDTVVRLQQRNQPKVIR